MDSTETSAGLRIFPPLEFTSSVGPTPYPQTLELWPLGKEVIGFELDQRWKAHQTTAHARTWLQETPNL